MPTSIHVTAQSVVIGAVVPVTWRIDPACVVIETGLLLGPDPTALVPVGQPIYGQRQNYQQDIPLPESGQYWLAAYAREESGSVTQSPPWPITVLVPPSLPETSKGSHGAPPSYDGTDADFLKPAGNPHFASFRRSTVTDQAVRTQTFTHRTQPHLNISERSVGASRFVASTHRDEVLAQQTDPLVVEDPVLGRLTFEESPAAVRSGLDVDEKSFQTLGFPRSGLYTVSCVFNNFRCDGLSGESGPQVTYAETFFDSQDLRSGFRQTRTESQRSQVAYFIPRLPPGKRLQSATLAVTGGILGDFSALRLSGKPPTTILLRCPGAGCFLRAVWDFTDEARALAQQGGGELHLTLDPIPPETVEFEDSIRRSLTRHAIYTFSLDADYPWRHGVGSGGLTLTFAEDCPKKLDVSVTPKAVRPRLSATATGEPATVTVEVTTCPPENGTPPPSVEVKFEVQPPQASSPDTGGHAHNTARLKGSLDRSVCTASLDAQGTGSCTVTYSPSEVSGVETVVAEAEGFPKAEPKKVTVQVPGLIPMPEDPTKYVLVGAPHNHAGTNDPCRSTAPTSRHDQNHFSQPRLNSAVVAIADRMLRETGILLRVNDMSLPQGGLFDIRNNWNTPHTRHRVGLNVDIGFSGIRNGACTAYEQRQLQRVILQATNNDPVIEGDHFHAFAR